MSHVQDLQARLSSGTGETPPPDAAPNGSTPGEEPFPMRRRRPVLGVRVRILATVLALAALGMMLAGAATVVVQRDALLSQADDSLVADVREFEAHVHRGPATSTAADVRALLRSALEMQAAADDEAFLALVDGRPAYVTPGPRRLALEREPAFLAQVSALPADAPAVIREVTTSVGPVRYVAVQVRMAGRPEVGTYVVAVQLRPLQEQVVADARRYALVSVLALVVVGLGGWVVAGRLLRPLRLLRTTADRISSTELTARIPVQGKDDVTELTRTVNAMLDRLEAAFGDQQQFLDDAGHELRTPLTILRGHLELMDAEDSADVEQTRALLLDETDRMARLVDDLITLAQAGRPDFLHVQEVDVDGLVADVLVKARALGQRTWIADGTAQALVTADPQRLTQALLQLAANAVRYTRSGDEIGIGAGLDDGRVRLWVRDSGPGVLPEDATRIFDRFGRGQWTSGSAQRGDEGSGLGLAIVQGIAAAHGGQVVLDRTGGPGACFVLMLPAEAVAAVGVVWT